MIWAVSLGPVYWKLLFTTVQVSPRSLKLQGKILPDQHWRSVFYHKKNERYVKMKVKLKNQIYAIFKSRLLLCCFMQMVFVLKYINRKESKLS